MTARLALPALAAALLAGCAVSVPSPAAPAPVVVERPVPSLQNGMMMQPNPPLGTR